jgi:NAD(P)-dependent dehydrogenase (short-subunit alcohol dehydrogenase family)
VTLRRKVLVIGAKSSIISNYLAYISEGDYEVYQTFRSTKNVDHDNFLVYELNLNLHESILNFKDLIEGEEFDFILFSIGATSGTPIETDSLQHIEETIRVNMSSQIFLLPTLVEKLSEKGALCFIGSSAADGASFDIAYAASKAGIRAAVKSFIHTRELRGKRILLVEPSLVEGSTMYQEMTESNIERHRAINSGELLQLSDIGKTLIEIMLKPDEFETLVRIRPGATT